MNIIVVGAGIAGSWFTRLAREAGHKVTLISAGIPDSIAATAVLRRGYHAKNHDDQLSWDRSMQLYERFGFGFTAGATVTNYRVPGERFDKDWRLLDPAGPLVSPDLNASVRDVRRNSVTLRDDLHNMTADFVVKATGASFGDYTGNFGRRSYGVTWTNRDTSMLGAGLRIHHFAPYKTIAAGVAGGVARLGSSSAASPEKATEQAVKMLDLAVRLGITPSRDGWTPILGSRLKLTDARTPRTGKVFPYGFWEMRGYHRTGYAMAPADAESLLRQI